MIKLINVIGYIFVMCLGSFAIISGWDGNIQACVVYGLAMWVLVLFIEYFKKQEGEDDKTNNS